MIELLISLKGRNDKIMILDIKLAFSWWSGYYLATYLQAERK